MTIGRPKLPAEKRKINMGIMLLPSTVAKLRILAKKNRMSLSAFARFILERRVSLEDEDL
jgi:hypothetical protein